MREYERVIDSIVSGYDLSSDLGRRKAFNACAKYADRKLGKSIDYNYFISLAAKRCGCDPVINNVLRLVTSDGSEKVILRYTKNGGPCLSANRNGLAYLSNAFAVLASSKLPGEHFHLRHGEFPMVGRPFPLTVYLHDEAWFEEQEKIATSSTDTPEEISRRDIDPNSILALIITDHLPTQMMLTSERLYLVRRVERLVDQKAWKKCIRESIDRM